VPVTVALGLRNSKECLSDSQSVPVRWWCWPKKRPNCSGMTTSGRSTCCSACSVRRRGLAAIALRTLDIKLDGVRTRVVEVVGRGSGLDTRMIPFTARSKEALNHALREALSLGHNHIGTEHILLGVARPDAGPVVQILLDFGADSEAIRRAVVPLLPPPSRHTTELGEPRPPQLIILCPDCAEPIEAIPGGEASPQGGTTASQATPRF
jgi:hypothetical protein